MWLGTGLTGLYLLPITLAASIDSTKPPQFHNSACHAAADPYVFYDSGSSQYYAYSTEGADQGSLFAIYSSPDLATWHHQPGGVLKACYDTRMNRIEGGQACWARDWQWAPETYYNEKTGWYFFFFAGRLREDLTKDHFRYSAFEEPSKVGVAVSRSPTGPFHEIESNPIDWYPFDPNYHDVNLIMDDKQMLPPQTLTEGQGAPKGTYIPFIDPNILFDNDGRIYLYASRNAYRNWNWDDKLGKYIEESNIIMVELDRAWWDDPLAATMPQIIDSQKNAHLIDAPRLPCNITRYNGTGELGHPPRKDGWKTVISYGADPQGWENYHVNDYTEYNGTKKDRRWAEGSTVITRPDTITGKPVYLLTYSANNYEAANYGVGFATAKTPLGPFRKSLHNPVLFQIPDGPVPIYSTGHGSIVASPPRTPSETVGAQEIQVKTPDGAELFYVHHARNDTTANRSLYTTRLTVNASSIHFESDNAISMHLTPLDQALPANSYPIQMGASCSGTATGGQQLAVRVTSKQNGAFDLTEGSNRVLVLPGYQQPATEKSSEENDGTFIFTFNSTVEGLAYQRSTVDGGWVDEAIKELVCA